MTTNLDILFKRDASPAGVISYRDKPILSLKKEALEELNSMFVLDMREELIKVGTEEFKKGLNAIQRNDRKMLQDFEDKLGEAIDVLSQLQRM